MGSFQWSKYFCVNLMESSSESKSIRALITSSDKALFSAYSIASIKKNDFIVGK
jgi:hypothetical protein